MIIENKKIWQREFKEFLEIDVSRFNPPKAFFTKLERRLFPHPWMVFSKVAFVHVIFGLLSLSVCNQFGLNPFDTNFSLSDWFMKIGGHGLCMSLCGILFMASTYLFSNLFLTLEELESIQRHKWLQTGVFGLVSLAAFYFFGAQLVGAFTLLWLLGALIGGVLSLELSYRLRQAWV
ncbi:MAG: hypothetical protein A3I05_06050 [Deltaproteobacteria bacterium RIFCSPLOWO2_02_FULL_44_10]|nr:MAG: hypothetical protein A3C46_04055 [Deltaproteobacteria bacterium RIFCSPHIGHO2_02_FULL_44_16]OGQ45679.1 MAG: hypothetical protein A3I05_06050 [Deltaproteobacteria bacterium RIFCSPLOWO2_02_FULL_44_10]